MSQLTDEVSRLGRNAAKHDAQRKARISALLCAMSGYRITTSYDPKPIPVRDFDWIATDDNYEPGCPIGYGKTETEAVADLLEQLEK